MTQVAPLFKEMEDYIATSRASVAAGQDVELAGLDQNIEKLCNLILALSQEEKMMYEARLQALLESLNALGLELKSQYDGNSITQHRTASVAYQTADARDNFGKRGEE